MNILGQLDTDLTQSLKAKDELVLLTLRQTKTALTNAEIANNREPLTEEQIIKVLRSEIKKRKDAIELYKKGNREELAQKEQKEIGIISKYLPPEISEEEIRKAVKLAIEKSGASGLQDLGKVMGLAMAQLKGQADGNKVSQVVKEELSK